MVAKVDEDWNDVWIFVEFWNIVGRAVHFAVNKERDGYVFLYHQTIFFAYISDNLVFLVYSWLQLRAELK